MYQHAGMRQDAMKCLARLGDTKKMVEFAQLARDPNLFVLAANYLRSALTWQNDIFQNKRKKKRVKLITI